MKDTDAENRNQNQNQIEPETETKTGTQEPTPESVPAPDHDGTQEGTPERTTPKIDVVDNMESRVFELAQDYINALDNPDEIYQNNGLFVDMIKRIYRYYLGDIIGNNKDNSYNFRYDYDLMDKIFWIYTSLVYKYKQNKRPSILEYSLFVNMDRNTVYHTAMGMNKSATPETIRKVKNWYLECESQLTNGGSVFEIFLLKSQYRYNDNLAPLPVESQGGVLGVSELPDLNIAKIAKKDSKPDHKKG